MTHTHTQERHDTVALQVGGMQFASEKNKVESGDQLDLQRANPAPLPLHAVWYGPSSHPHCSGRSNGVRAEGVAPGATTVFPARDTTDWKSWTISSSRGNVNEPRPTYRACIARECAMGWSGTRNDANQRYRLRRRFACFPWSAKPRSSVLAGAGFYRLRDIFSRSSVDPPTVPTSAFVAPMTIGFPAGTT